MPRIGQRSGPDALELAGVLLLGALCAGCATVQAIQELPVAWWAGWAAIFDALLQDAMALARLVVLG